MAPNIKPPLRITANGLAYTVVGAAHQTAEYKHGSDDAYRNVPGDDLLPEHVCQTEQEGNGTNLTRCTGTEALACSTKEKAQRVGQLLKHRAVACLDGCLHDSQRSGSCCGIGIAEQLSSPGHEVICAGS